MKGKTLCIVIALMVLSVSAIIVANPGILGEFSSTLNRVPVQVTISRQDNGTITTMRAEDLVENWADHNQRFVRFMGIVKSVTSIDTGIELELEVSPERASVFVYPLDSPRLPMEYQEEHVYEFTGFFLAEGRRTGSTDTFSFVNVYAFEIRHHGKGESQAEAVERLQNAGNSLD